MLPAAIFDICQEYTVLAREHIVFDGLQLSGYPEANTTLSSS